MTITITIIIIIIIIKKLLLLLILLLLLLLLLLLYKLNARYDWSLPMIYASEYRRTDDVTAHDVENVCEIFPN